MSAIRTAAIPRALAPTRVRATTVLLWAMVAANVLFLIGLLVSEGRTSVLVNIVLSMSTQWIPVAIVWLVAWRTGFTRWPIVLTAIGVTFNAMGDSYYSLAMDSEGYLAFPSPAEAGYLLFYPLMVAALIALVRHSLGRSGRLVLLESAVATLGASAVLAVIVDPVISDALAGDDALASAVALAYPVFDLLIIAAIIGIAAVPTASLGRRWWALVAGLGVWAAADVTYALVEHGGTYFNGAPLDSGWSIGLALITWWVVGASGDAPDATTPRRAFLVPVPAVAVLAGLAVLVVATQVQLSTLAVTLAGLTVGLAAVPIIFRQAMLGRMLAARDQAMARLTELDRDKSDMMVTMNHEFRTPLTSINGHVELLLDGDGGELPPLAVGMLRTIESNGARLQDLVDDMLTVSRLEEGEALGVRTPLYVSGLVSRAAALVAAQARTRRVELATECDNFALVVDADGTQLERAVVNLVDNAVKFTPAGGRVVVRAEGPTADGEIVIVVRDNGMGIPQEDIPRLFTRFFRARNVQGAAIPGVGLGLSITQRVIQAHDGTICVASVLGEGTTVTVRLPVSLTGVQRPRPQD